MATVAKYYFEDSDSYEKAVSRMNNEVGWQSEYSWEAQWPYIWIKDGCSYEAVAGKICRAYGGDPC